MRLSRADFRSACKSFLRIEFASQDITAFGGLELIRRYLGLIFSGRVQSVLGRYGLGRDYRAIDMILVIVGLILAGGRRLDHLNYLCNDPVVKRFCGLLRLRRERQRWHPLRESMGFFELPLSIAAWKKTLRVVVYRKPVHHQTKKNYQLELFDPDDGYFEYSAASTNLALSAGALWDFMAGRGAQGKTFAELKGEWALDVVFTRHYGANSAWQQISVLGDNPLRNFQLQTLVTPKPRSRKRTYGFFLQSLKTLRFKLIHQPARLVKPKGYHVRRFSVAPPAQQLIETIDQKLKSAA